MRPARLTWTDPDRLDDQTREGFLGAGGFFELAPDDVHGASLATFVNAPGSIAAMVESAANHGDKPFLVGDGVTMDFASVGDLVATKAAALATNGVERGDRVLVAGVPSIDHSLTVLAVSWLGGVIVDVNPRSTATEFEHVVEMTSPALAVVDYDARRALPDGLTAIDFDSLSDADSTPVEAATVDRDDPAIVIFTSGTTGRPKGATLTHRSVGHFCFASAVTVLVKGLVDPVEDAPAAGGPPTAIACSPMFHVSGLLGQLLNSLAWGSTLVYAPSGRWDPATHLELSARHGVTMWSLVPTQLQRLIDHPDLDAHDLSSLQSVGGGGATFSPELLRRTAERLPGVSTSMRVGYGMTESGGLLTMLLPPYGPDEAASVGAAVAGCEVEIRDELGKVVDEGVVGEIWGRSAGLFAGYWDDPEATAEVFDDDRWYRTGDYGRIVDGRLHLESRLRDMIIRGGENIYPIEIENRLCEHPAVADAAVVGVAHDDLGEEVKAVVERRPGSTVEAEELRTWCAETLARHKVPSIVEFATLPRNDVGKVLKRELA